MAGSKEFRVDKGFYFVNDAMKEATIRTLESGQYYMGPENDQFEAAVSAFLGTDHAVAVNSGSTGMFLILKAMGIGPGDEVLVPAMGFVTLAEAVYTVGARARFSEIETETYNLDPTKLEAAMTPAVKAVVVAHNYGHPADMDAVTDFAAQHGLRVIEDCAHSFGAKFDGKYVGSIGDAGFLSFAGKSMSVCGLGGMVVTNDDVIGQEVRLLRDHGRPRSQGERFYEILRAGYNLRLSELHAAIGRVQFPHLTEWNEKRLANSLYYTEKLEAADVPVTCPKIRPEVQHAFLHYTIRVHGNRRDDLMDFLTSEGIRTTILYPTDLFLLPPYREAWEHQPGDFPVSEQVTREILSLPNHPGIRREDQDLVVAAIEKFFL